MILELVDPNRWENWFASYFDKHYFLDYFSFCKKKTSNLFVYFMIKLIKKDICIGNIGTFFMKMPT